MYTCSCSITICSCLKWSKIHMFMFGYGIVCVHNGVFIYSWSVTVFFFCSWWSIYMFIFGYSTVSFHDGLFTCSWLVTVFLFFCSWWSFYMFMFGYSTVSVHDGVFTCSWSVTVFCCSWWSNLHVHVWKLFLLIINVTIYYMFMFGYKIFCVHDGVLFTYWCSVTVFSFSRSSTSWILV